MNSTTGQCQHCQQPGAVKRLSLPLNCSWIAAGCAVDTAAQWVRVVVLLHLGGEVMVGALALAFAVCTPVYGLASLGLRGAVATDAKREYQFGDYFALRLVTSVLALLIVAGIAWASGHEPETALLILLAGVTELLKALSDVFHALQHQNERMDRYAISLMIRGPLMVMALTAGVWWTGSLVWGLAALAVVAAATLLLYDVPSGRRMVRALQSAQARSHGGVALHASGLMPRWDPPTMLRLAWLAAPLGVVISMIALQISVPRYLVSFYLGNHALGVFVSIFYLGMVGSQLVGAIGQSSGPRLAKYYAAADTVGYSKLLGKLVLVAVGLGTATALGVALLGGPILALIYRPHFAQYAELAVCLMLAAAAGYLTHPLGIALEAMRRFKTHMVIRTLGIVVLLAAGTVLIPAYGLKGAAVAMMISSTSAVLGCAGVVLWSLRRCNATERTGIQVEVSVRQAA